MEEETYQMMIHKGNRNKGLIFKNVPAEETLVIYSILKQYGGRVAINTDEEVKQEKTEGYRLVLGLMLWSLLFVILLLCGFLFV